MSRAKVLREVAERLRDLAADLDVRTEKCGTCNLTHYLNRSEYQAKETLMGIVERLERLSGQDWAAWTALPLDHAAKLRPGGPIE